MDGAVDVDRDGDKERDRNKERERYRDGALEVADSSGGCMGCFCPENIAVTRKEG